MRSVLLVAVLASLVACNDAKVAPPNGAATTGSPVSSGVPVPSPAGSVASATPASAESATTTTPARFGAPIASATTVALADIAKNPAAYRGKSVVTTGTVNAVCQERGCWMELQDGPGKTADANVRMHGHAFFMPKSAKGKRARVQGTVVLVKDGKECDEMETTGAQLELDATGVELL